MIRFWVKFFDSKMIGSVQEGEYLETLEQLVRGTSIRKQDETTIQFAMMLQKMLRDADCLKADTNELNDEKFMEAMRSGAVDIQVLCSALGRT